ncbi:hypothetical protein [Sulfuricurvum sp.]|uniref:hypothetical protein n=1 Tax=Sulfuricurvum sp. TaxID=2025608 RepID=UPI00286E8707|nr:hypothetical protein [Sulfuricurvum sp.]
MHIILYLHILAACAWIGGGLLLFGLGIFIREKEIQERIYGAIGPFYGYFESVWLLILITTGFVLAGQYNLFQVSGDGSELGSWVHRKMVLVGLISLATLVHLYIAFATHGKKRTRMETLLSRGGSLSIFLLNLAILAVAIQIRTIL